MSHENQIPKSDAPINPKEAAFTGAPAQVDPELKKVIDSIGQEVLGSTNPQSIQSPAVRVDRYDDIDLGHRNQFARPHHDDYPES